MSAMASQITSFTIVYSSVYSRRRSKITSKLRVTGLCAWNSPMTDEFPTQRVSNAENVSIWWRHHEKKAFVKWVPDPIIVLGQVIGQHCWNECADIPWHFGVTTVHSEIAYPNISFEGIDCQTICVTCIGYHNIIRSHGRQGDMLSKYW